jgi:hypothetical protein
MLRNVNSIAKRFGKIFKIPSLIRGSLFSLEFATQTSRIRYVQHSSNGSPSRRDGAKPRKGTVTDMPHRVWDGDHWTVARESFRFGHSGVPARLLLQHRTVGLCAVSCQQAISVWLSGSYQPIVGSPSPGSSPVTRCSIMQRGASESTKAVALKITLKSIHRCPSGDERYCSCIRSHHSNESIASAKLSWFGFTYRQM